MDLDTVVHDKDTLYVYRTGRGGFDMCFYYVGADCSSQVYALGSARQLLNEPMRDQCYECGHYGHHVTEHTTESSWEYDNGGWYGI